MDQETINQMIDPTIWREAMSALASGVTIVACQDSNKQPQGMTVSAFCSLSMEPPLLLVCIIPEARCYPHILRSGYFSVNILQRAQEEISNKFATTAEDERFSGVSHTRARSGSPFITGSLVSIDCQLEQDVVGGDHQILFGKPLEILFHEENTSPLLYWKRGYRGLNT